MSSYKDYQDQRVVMWFFWVLTFLAIIGTVGLLIGCALSFSLPLLLGVVLMATAAVAAGCTASYYMEKPNDSTSAFGSNVEVEILSKKQREQLREARAEIIMEHAMVDIEQERANIEWRKMEDANDMERPPYQTSFTNRDGTPKSLGGPQPPPSRGY